VKQPCLARYFLSVATTGPHQTPVGRRQIPDGADGSWGRTSIPTMSGQTLSGEQIPDFGVAGWLDGFIQDMSPLGPAVSDAAEPNLKRKSEIEAGDLPR